ncbi:MAG: Ni/Fe-hydrogenase cytochrome b subunit [Proteobacteria bacterium]|nr:Ni/Fe-hydrogenase cytochrome b subunit [Pseudomonadota bacterium]
MTTRLTNTKTVLWAIVGMLAAVSVARFAFGLGATTGLSDVTPWGFWIAFDVMAGVALAAGGFVLAATVYIFRLEKYRAFVRPAILTALLGYAAVAVGLIYDLGLPWHIWHPIVYPQPHSALFEVAMCVMLYLTVLLLEFGHVILEHKLFDTLFFRRILAGLKKATIPLVIAGIVLSTLHQSSLGTLFLIAPYRLHPLWYSPIIWILFFVSAAGLGLLMVTAESFFSAWLFGHKLRMDKLSGLVKAASLVLFLYLALRIGDLAVRGMLPMAFDGSGLSWLFLFELLVSALAPAILLAIPRIRQSPRAIGLTVLMAIFGIVGYRFNVCIVAFKRPEAMSYFPSWMEVAVSFGIVAGAMLVFIFFAEHLRVYNHDEEEEQTPSDHVPLATFGPQNVGTLVPESMAASRRYSLALIFGASAAVAFFASDVLHGSESEPIPVTGARTIFGSIEERSDGPGHRIIVADESRPTPSAGSGIPLSVVDGNRDGRMVLFAHDTHVKKLGAETSCSTCHHQNLPFKQNSACSQCHRDMYSETDTFSHSLHVEKLEGNAGCIRCHADPQKVKTRDTTTPCITCHKDMIVEGSIVPKGEKGLTGMAAGYMDAMHGLCIRCHEQNIKDHPETYKEPFAQCLNCHRDASNLDLSQRGPFQRTAP